MLRAGSIRDRRLVLFLLVGGLNTVVGYALFMAFLWFGLGSVAALAFATIIGVLFNFQSIGRIVFAGGGSDRLFPFVAVYAVQFALNALALRALESLGVSPLLAQAAMVPFVAIGGFLAMRRFVFADRA